jgi:H+/Cl- antiporter ClcA
MISVRNLTALIPAVLVCCGGYYLYESLIYKSFVSPIASVPFNLVQSALGGIIFVLLGVLIDKNHGLRKIFKQNLQ